MRAERRVKLHHRILGGHCRDREHADEHRNRAVGLGERAELDAEPQARHQEGRLHDQEPTPRSITFSALPNASVTTPSTAVNSRTESSCSTWPNATVM